VQFLKSLESKDSKALKYVDPDKIQPVGRFATWSATEQTSTKPTRANTSFPAGTLVRRTP
jgi:hypothetical protein